VDGLPGRNFDGKITRFSYSLDDPSKTMLAETELLNPKLELRPGMYAIVKIGIERKEDALLVPVDALLIEKSGVSLFTIADNKAKKDSGENRFNDGINAEILSGLKSDQSVILIGKRRWPTASQSSGGQVRAKTSNSNLQDPENIQI